MRCFENVGSVWIVALHAVHAPFQYGMMLWQPELRVHFDVTLKASRRLAAGINDQLSPASRLDVPAARPVARFAAAGLAARRVGNVNARVRAG